MRILARLWKRAVGLIPFWHGPQPPADWLLYKLDGHPPSEFYFSIFAHVLAGDEIRELTDEDIVGAASNLPRAPFIYIGHGTPDGSYSSTGYTEGLRDFLCDGARADSFVGSPHIWWSCYSAIWLGKCRRSDWFGYGTLIGVDPRSGQEQWWRDHLQAVVRAIVEATRNPDATAGIATAAARVHEDAVHQYYAAQRISWISVLCARSFSVGADWRKDFGRRQE